MSAPPTPASRTPIVGIIGGGQLARMTHQAAISLGIATAVLCPEPDAPAVLAGAHHVEGRADRFDDLVRLAAQVDVVTVDHERAPAPLLDRLARAGHRVAPGAAAARLGQDKAAARAVLGRQGIATAPWIVSAERAEIEAFAAEHGWPVMAKAPTGGYDGRGVWPAAGPADVQRALDAAPGPLLVEPMLGFDHELSVVVARSVVDGEPQVAAYDPVETIQQDGQCAEVLAPAPVDPMVAAAAQRTAVAIAEAVGLEGVMAVELFVVDGRLLLNELAVRPHNSGHLTIEACVTSQFENHLRGVLGLPLGSTEMVAGAASMRNVLGPAHGGDPFDGAHRALAIAGIHLHRYAKEPRPNRKVGHVTATAPELGAARAATAEALAVLGSTSPTPQTDHRSRHQESAA